MCMYIYIYTCIASMVAVRCLHVCDEYINVFMIVVYVQYVLGNIYFYVCLFDCMYD